MVTLATRSDVLAMGDATNTLEAGGKAAALAKLIAAGFNVPAFYVLPQVSFPDSGLPDASRDEIRTAAAKLGPGPYAVRSSAVDEDGAEHSHAGQFLSVLNVKLADVASEAERVYASGRAESVEAYRLQSGIVVTEAGPSVIVQQMVSARCAGVLFTAEPVSGRRDRIVVSATHGLGDRLVGGEVDGEAYVLDRDGETIARPDGMEGALCLSDDDLAQLHQLALAVEEAAGHPQDIEWAFDANTLYLLQSRPITTTLRPMPVADQQLAIFDNSNIVESYPGQVSPLTFSFAQYVYARVYRRFLEILGVNGVMIRDNRVVLDNMLARLNGRVYYNLLNWYRALALLPGYRTNRDFMETMMGVGEPLPAEVADRLAPQPASGFAKLGEYGRIAATGARLVWAGICLPRTIRTFDKRLNGALATERNRLGDLPLTALAHEYRQIESRLLDDWDAPLINDFLCMIAFGASRKLLERWSGTEGLALHNALMIGQGDLISAEPPRLIAEMADRLRGDEEAIARVEVALASFDSSTLDWAGWTRNEHGLDDQFVRLATEYVARFGDRCTEELKLESITLDEDPSPLLKSIIAAARQPVSAKSQTPETGPEAQITHLFEGHFLKRVVARQVLHWAKARVRDRENLRFERTRVFGHARQVFLAMGRQMHALNAIDGPRDIFYLTVAEVLGAIEGNAVSSDLKGLVAVRRAEEQTHRALAEPGERIEVRGACLSFVQLSARSTEDDNAAVGSGTGCSAGTVVARAKVVTDPHDAHLDAGEILVARHTDPGWIALFANAGGIVVERGSLLSHSAIVAREMGIPCVVGLKGATSWLKTGDEIEVDGATGVVKVVRRADEV
ncbi:MAG: PEP/pyruvate-binding domain-containing protein [Pseudomonadota bacterium]